LIFRRHKGGEKRRGENREKEKKGKEGTMMLHRLLAHDRLPVSCQKGGLEGKKRRMLEAESASRSLVLGVESIERREGKEKKKKEN